MLSVRPLACLGPSGVGGVVRPRWGAAGSEWAAESGGGLRAALGRALRASASTSAVFTHHPRGAHVRGRGPAGTARPPLSALGLAFDEDPTLQMVGLGPGRRGFRPQLGGQEWESNSTWCRGGCEEGGMEVALTGQAGFLSLSTSFQPENPAPGWFSSLPKTLLPAVGPSSVFLSRGFGGSVEIIRGAPCIQDEGSGLTVVPVTPALWVWKPPCLGCSDGSAGKSGNFVPCLGLGRLRT